MRIPWIRVHGQLIRKSVTIRLAEATHINPHEAVGVLVTFWSNVAANVVNGQVANRTDRELEAWADWQRKRGTFAKWVREQHLDADGRVREWDEYGGKLEAIRERDRLRKSTGIPQEVHRNGNGNPGNSLATRAEGKEREGKEPTEKSKEPRKRAALPDWVNLAEALWTTKIGTVTPARIRRALGKLVDAYGWLRVADAMEVYASADEGPGPGKSRRIEWFADDFHAWRTLAETPIDDGQGGLTERGKRLLGMKS